MPKRKTPVEKPEKQFERFVKAAHEHDVDLHAAEKSFDKLSTKPSPASPPTKGRETT